MPAIYAKLCQLGQKTTGTRDVNHSSGIGFVYAFIRFQIFVHQIFVDLLTEDLSTCSPFDLGTFTSIKYKVEHDEQGTQQNNLI